MPEAELLRVEVVCATPKRQKLLELQVTDGSTAREVLLASALDEHFPEIDLQKSPLGIFGCVVDDDHRVRAGDRVEVYWPLLNEPREARRAAAASGGTMGSKCSESGEEND